LIAEEIHKLCVVFLQRICIMPVEMTREIWENIWWWGLTGQWLCWC